MTDGERLLDTNVLVHAYIVCDDRKGKARRGDLMANNKMKTKAEGYIHRRPGFARERL